MGFFPINILHNIVHLAVGAWGLASYPSLSRARLFARGLAIFYGLLTIMGLIPALNLNTTFGLIPIHGADILLHTLTAVIAVFVGFLTPSVLMTEQQDRQREMSGTTSNR